MNDEVTVGFEFHQQLDTEEKLFCGCPPVMREPDESDYSLVRHLHPTESELGEVDPAALREARKGKVFRYLGFSDSTCLVEDDEEPPRRIDREALDVVLQVALLTDSDPVDRLEVMRKIVIDGSNTAGFQRTGLVSLGGEVETSEGPVGIESIALEEESAQRQGEEKGHTVYSLDRLGIPLIEIGCAPDIHSPEQAREFAETVGTILRSTGKVRRGIGTIRQDVNISVPGGHRVELKGVQELAMVETYVEREAERQRNLIEIAEELEERGVTEVEAEPVDITAIFKNTDSSLIGGTLNDGGRAYALRLEGFDDLLGRKVQPDRRLGTELSDRAKVAGVGGIFHTDELPAYGVTEDEVTEMRDAVDASPEDAVVLVAAEEETALDALEEVVQRAREALDGVPGETRRPLPDGNSEYMRPLPGAARMYPETDVPSVDITRDLLNEIREGLPELIPERAERYREEYGLNRDLARQMASSNRFELFEEAVNQVGADPTLAVRTLLHYPKEVGVDVSDARLREVLEAVASGDVAKEAIPDILEALGEQDRPVPDVIEDLGLSGLSDEELRSIVRGVVEERREFVEERGMGAVGPLMGPVMGKVRGQADGARVNEVLREELQRVVEETTA